MLNMHFLMTVALPVGVLAVLALVLPIAFTPKNTRSQWRLGGGVVCSAVSLLMIGAVFMAVLYRAEGAELVQASVHDPRYVVLFFVKRSLMATLIWAPVLALAWFSAAQKIERFKGKDGIRIGLGRRPNTPPPDAASVEDTPKTTHSQTE